MSEISNPDALDNSSCRSTGMELKTAQGKTVRTETPVINNNVIDSFLSL